MFDMNNFPPYVELMRISAFDWGTLFGAMARIVDLDDQRSIVGQPPILKDDERAMLLQNCASLRDVLGFAGLNDLSAEYEKRMGNDPSTSHDSIEPLFAKVPISISHLLSGLVVVLRHYKHYEDWTMDAIAHTLNNVALDIMAHISNRNAFRGVDVPDGIPEEFE